MDIYTFLVIAVSIAIGWGAAIFFKGVLGTKKNAGRGKRSAANYQGCQKQSGRAHKRSRCRSKRLVVQDEKRF